MKEKVKKEIIPIIFVILDGWGIAPDKCDNPISLAKTPIMDCLFKHYPNTQITAHGSKVGLFKDQDGNSEAGHLNIGSGRIVKSDAVNIAETIANKTFFNNPALIEAVNHSKKYKSNIHLMGLLSDGQSAHSQPDHLYAILDFLKQKKCHNIYLHLFTDGRDSSPHSATNLITKLISNFKNDEVISTIMGRFYAMDRIKAWKRTQMAYNTMVMGEGIVSDNPYKAITEAYDRNETDEFIIPTIILNNKKKAKFINDNDSVIFFNLRSDRARQLTKPFVQENFKNVNGKTFKRKKILKNLKFIGLTAYGPDLDSALFAFPHVSIENTLPLVIKDYKQLYISEREKYAHVTYFLNGGHSSPLNGEEWEVIPSIGLNYAKHPQMSTEKLTTKVVSYLEKGKYDFIAINFPNADMVGHTGDLKAAIKAIEVIDKNLARICKVIDKKNGILVITADHGNVEEMLNSKTGEIDTEHSTNPVPFIIMNKKLKDKKLRLRSGGLLSDVAPTIIDLFKLVKSKEMTGKSLVSKKIISLIYDKN